MSTISSMPLILSSSSNNLLHDQANHKIDITQKRESGNRGRCLQSQLARQLSSMMLMSFANDYCRVLPPLSKHYNSCWCSTICILLVVVTIIAFNFFLFWFELQMLNCQQHLLPFLHFLFVHCHRLSLTLYPPRMKEMLVLEGRRRKKCCLYHVAKEVTNAMACTSHLQICLVLTTRQRLTSTL